MKPNHAKRIYTAERLWRDLPDMPLYLASYLRAPDVGALPDDLRERLWLAMTSVNRCRYCRMAHSAAALAAAVDQVEIDALLGGEVGSVPAWQRPALLYAIHYAESEKSPAPERTAELYRIYGPEKAAAILRRLRVIWINNLSGNTVDALKDRLAGNPHPEGNLILELIVGAAGFGATAAIEARHKGA